MQRLDVVLLRQRDQQGQDRHDGAEDVHQATDDDQEQVQDDQEADLGVDELAKPGQEPLGDHLLFHEVVRREDHGHDEDDGADQDHGLPHQLGQVTSELDLSVDQHLHDQQIDAGECGDLVERDPPRGHQAQQHHRQHGLPEGLLEGYEQLAKVKLRALDPQLCAHIPGVEAEDPRQEDPGEEAGQEQPLRRDIR